MAPILATPRTRQEKFRK